MCIVQYPFLCCKQNSSQTNLSSHIHVHIGVLCLCASSAFRSVGLLKCVLVESIHSSSIPSSGFMIQGRVFHYKYLTSSIRPYCWENFSSNPNPHPGQTRRKSIPPLQRISPCHSFIGPPKKIHLNIRASPLPPYL